MKLLTLTSSAFRLILKAIFPLLVTLTFLTSPILAQQQVMMQEKKEIIYPVNSSNIHSTTDLLPLKPIFQDKEVIAMGEATHGTKEFFELKSKMFRYLVEEHNVKVFGIEASYAGCLYVNDYVQEGKGNLDTVMRKLGFWPWQTEEVKQLLLWMRAYNQNKAETEKVSFYGFDMQSFNPPLDYLYNYILINHSAEAPSFLQLIAPVYNRQGEIYKAFFSQGRKRALDTMEMVYSNVVRWFDQKEATYKLATSPKKHQQVRLCLQNLRESVLHDKIEGSQYAFRDSCMAGMVRQIKALENAKIFLWGHNGHITKHLAMGTHLKDWLGEKFYNIGFVFHQGTFHALQAQRSLASKLFSRFVLRRRFIKPTLKECSVSSSPQGSIASTFSQLNQPAFFIDLTNAQNKLFTSWQVAYSIGAMFMNRNNSLHGFIPVQHYDGILFVNSTKPTQLLL